MKSKALISIVAVFLLLMIISIYFVFNATSNDVSQEAENVQVSDNDGAHKLKDQVNFISSSNDNQNTEHANFEKKSEVVQISTTKDKQVVVDQVLHSTNAKEKNIEKDLKSKDKNALKTKVENEKTIEANFNDLQRNQTTLEVSVLNKNQKNNDKGVLTLTDKHGKLVATANFNQEKYFFKQILPGEYIMHFNYQGMSMQRTIEILPQQKNVAEISVPGSTLALEVKNADGAIITNVMITLYSGEKYRHENSFLGNQMVTPGDGKGSYYLMPKVPYCVVIEEDFRFNYQVNVIGPFVLEPGETKKVNYILPYARQLPKIQIVDTQGNPLVDVGFNFSDENGNFFQRTLKKEWDLYPYSNQDGFLPQRGWPIGNFTLIVGKEGYEFREVVIPIDFDANQLLQIKLNKASSITCNFSQTLIFPIAVGILNKVGDLIQKPIPVANHNKHELTVYFDNINSGNVKFNDLAAGEYYIGYFWNGSRILINKQGPFILGVEENLIITNHLAK